MNGGLIGRTIGNYVVRREVGRGGMGTVYLAEHSRLQRAVAIKVLREELGRDPGIVWRFFNEARAASDIRNAHIVDVIDFGELAEGTPYLMMEWLEGRSLSDVLAADGKLPLSRTAHIVEGIGAALAAAHAHGVIHRDLKPDNVFLVSREGDPDFVKVVDFGVAKLLQRSDTTAPRTAADAVIGTAEYMSPEQCRSQNSTLDGRSDVYALGLIAFEMVTGRRPFLASSYVGNLVAHLGELPPSPRELVPELPPAVERTILKALEKERDRRHATMNDFVAEFHAGVLDAQASGLERAEAGAQRGRGARPRRRGDDTVPERPVSLRANAVQPEGPARAGGRRAGPGKRGILPKVALGVGAGALAAVLLAALSQGRLGLRPRPAVTQRAPREGASGAGGPAVVRSSPPAMGTAAAPGAPGSAPAPSRSPSLAPPPAPSPAAPTAPAVSPGREGTPPGSVAAQAPAGRPLPVVVPSSPASPASPVSAAGPTAALRPEGALARAKEGASPGGKRSLAPATGAPGHGDDASLSGRLLAESARLAPSGRRYGPGVAGVIARGSGLYYPVELEGGHCYTFVSVGSEGMSLQSFLWDPGGKRIGEHASGTSISCFTACAVESGAYRFQARAAHGEGRFRTAVLRSP